MGARTGARNLWRRSEPRCRRQDWRRKPSSSVPDQACSEGPAGRRYLMFTFRHGGAVLALAVSTLAFQAPAPAAAFDGFSPVSMQTLDHVRGGFSMEMNYGQLMLAMNTTQVSVINGIVVPGQQIIGSSGGSSTLIQQGLNNSVNPVVLNNIPSGSMSTVIQNGLNDQVIGS